MNVCSCVRIEHWDSMRPAEKMLDLCALRALAQPQKREWENSNLRAPKFSQPLGWPKPKQINPDFLRSTKWIGISFVAISKLLLHANRTTICHDCPTVLLHSLARYLLVWLQMVSEEDETGKHHRHLSPLLLIRWWRRKGSLAHDQGPT